VPELVVAVERAPDRLDPSLHRVDPLARVARRRRRAADDDPAHRAAQAWDLAALAEEYLAWHRLARDLVRRAPCGSQASADERAFAVRSTLVHEWRKFLFTDPGLPAELLPAGWVGHEAAVVFAEQAARLQPAAARFVDACLSETEKSGVRT